MKVYLKVDENYVIRDCITYPYEGYVEYEIAEIPQGINGGWFKLENGAVVEYPELKPKTESDEIAELKQLVADLTEVVLGGI